MQTGDTAPKHSLSEAAMTCPVKQTQTLRFWSGVSIDWLLLRLLCICWRTCKSWYACARMFDTLGLFALLLKSPMCSDQFEYTVHTHRVS